MSKSISLSSRLRKVASYLSNGANFADIGSDHAYLPCYVCLRDKEARAIAGEINKGPYQSALETVRLYNLTDVVQVRIGDGLKVITLDDKINHVVIAGMGGSLIKSILEVGKDRLYHVDRIITQPNIDARNVREWLMNHQFSISDEAILEENGHIYEIVVADRSANQEILSEKELLFGPILLKRRNQVFLKKWKHEQMKLSKIVAQMKRAKSPNTDKIIQFEKELDWMKEVLHHGEPTNN